MNSKFREQPETDPLARKWSERVTQARRHWDRFHRRIRHNRQIVSGLDWNRDPSDDGFYMHRANLIHSTIMGILPGIYARNPEISVKPQHASRDLKLLCKTIETVTNRYLEDAGLKQRAKATVRAALTCSFGVLKVMYQREIHSDPLIHARIQDSQDNLVRARGLSMQWRENGQGSDADSRKEEIRQTVAAVDEKAEVGRTEGLVIDRVMTEHLLVDPAIAEFWDYEQADWMIQTVPMKKAVAEGLYGFCLDRATVYRHQGEVTGNSGRLFEGVRPEAGDDSQICVLEIWDKQTQRVYTMAEGCDFWLRDPYSPPKVGERWYPFFLLPFQTVDGCFVGPSIVDLTERLQNEHNTVRDRYNEHRDLIKPGYIASAEVNERTLKRFSDSELGEITLIDSDGQPIQQAIMPKSYPPIDPAVYDTSAVRVDWEMVTGLQDASRASVVKPKTATEANILQQSLSGRISEFRDQVEDFLQQIAQYTAEILIQELDVKQVEQIMGPHKTGLLPVSGSGELPVQGIVELAYDWPQLSKDEIFRLVQLKIRAGSTGIPDDLDRQESWTRLLPVIQPLIGQIMQFQLEGVNPTALIALLKETVLRFDDKLDLDEFVPDLDRKVAQDKVAVSAGQGVEGGSGTQPVPVVSGGNDGNGTSAMPQADVAGGQSGLPDDPAGNGSAFPGQRVAAETGNVRVPPASGHERLSPVAAQYLPPVWRQWLEREAGQAPAEMAGMPGPEVETGLRTATSGEGVPVAEAAGQKLLEAVVPMVEELLAKGRRNGRGGTRNHALKERENRAAPKEKRD